ncbi:MAG: nucleotidyltransferase domain-containing protein [Acidobacteria bacterium]|nr:nucleotidyltransferase domain-containing protein [Acidobacteriota bacterium]
MLQGTEPFTADQVLRSFLSRIEGLRPRLRRMVLFGSHARGDHRPDSDYDLLLVVKSQ